jgi:hypothetical protein
VPGLREQICSRPTEGVMSDWCAPLGRQRDAGRGADKDRLAARVDTERPQLERAIDEQVIQRADGQQRPSVAQPRRSALAEQPD